MSSRARVFVPLFLPLALVSCGQGQETHDDVEEAPHEAPRLMAKASTRTPPPSARQIDGHAFPEHVVALTWDDGPDLHTLELARYLHAQRVSATFFVVADWRKDISCDPGYGPHVFDTGYRKIPILGDLVRLGHRVGNHTLNHVILTDADAPTVVDELHQNEVGIEPFVTNELYVFRAPGGAWGPETAGSAYADPLLKALTGPVRWDVDRKDWQSSASCNSTHPHTECELGTRGLRTKPSVIARRYFASISSAGRGIVLLHDRVADVGSRYALELAEALVPELRGAGFVFAAPVLAFSPLAPRLELPLDPASLRFADVDGDGRADACARGPDGLACFAAFDRPAFASPSAAFHPAPRVVSTLGAELADVDGDGRADACHLAHDGVVCAGSRGAKALATAEFSDPDGWAADPAYSATIRFADIDGDKRADVCMRTPYGFACARSLGNGFEHARLWLAEMSDAHGWLAPEASSTIQLADVNGDGKADVCARGKDGLVCGLSTGGAFGRLERWSKDFGNADGWAKSAAYYGTIRFGDLNGDGRADVCGRAPDGVVCAFSTGHAFTTPTIWARASMTDADGWLVPGRAVSLQLADINGDGRADLCGMADIGVVCGLAP